MDEPTAPLPSGSPAVAESRRGARRACPRPCRGRARRNLVDDAGADAALRDAADGRPRRLGRQHRRAAGLLRRGARRQRHGLRRRHAPVGRARERCSRRSCSARPRCRCSRSASACKVERRPRLRHPAGQDAAAVDGYARAAPSCAPERGRRVAVDLFFRTLADTHGPHAAAIVLSGADGDGAIGIKRIKERGGLTIAQDPERGRALRHAALGDRDRHGRLGPAGRRDAGAPGRSTSTCARPPQAAARGRPAAGAAAGRPPDELEAALRDMLAYLRSQHRARLHLLQAGDDPAPHRRGACSVNGIDGPDRATSAFLRTPPGRGRRAAPGPADQRHQLLPRPRRASTRSRRRCRSCSRARRRTTRCASGSPACATGEEAYSIAMLLAEHARAARGAAGDAGVRDRPRRARRSATAREGVYPDGDRRRRVRRAPAPLLHARAARLPGAQRAARDGAVRQPRPAEGRAVLAPRPGQLPQPLHLPRTARRSSARSRSSISRSGRAAGCSSASPRRSTSAPAVPAGRQEAPHLRAAPVRGRRLPVPVGDGVLARALACSGDALPRAPIGAAQRPCRAPRGRAPGRSASARGASCT